MHANVRGLQRVRRKSPLRAAPPRRSTLSVVSDLDVSMVSDLDGWRRKMFNDERIQFVC